MAKTKGVANEALTPELRQTAKLARPAKPATPAASSRPSKTARTRRSGEATRPASGAATRGASREAGLASSTAPATPTSRDPGDAPSQPALSGVRDEMPATRDIARLLRYGERFGTDKIDVRMLPLQLHLRSGSLAVFDPAAPENWHVFDRRAGSGAFRVMLSVARPDETEGNAGAGPARERLAAVVIHVGRPPIAKWIVAQFSDRTSPDALPRTRTSSGWLALLDASDGAPGVLALPPATGVTPIEVPLTDGRRALALPCGNGQFTAYWAVDAADKPICIVFDFDAFTQKVWKAKPPSPTF